MKHKTLSGKDLGVIILSKFYLFLAVLHILPLCVFSTSPYLFGHKLSYFSAVLATALYIGFLYFLYDAIKRIKLAGFLSALLFQLFFVMNSIRILFHRTPFLNIQGDKIASLMSAKTIVVVNIAVNIPILILLIYYLYILIKNQPKTGKDQRD